jgi:hypothetical protein
MKQYKKHFKLTSNQKKALLTKFVQKFGNVSFKNLDTETRAGFAVEAQTCFGIKNTGVFGLGPFHHILRFMDSST